MKGIVNKFFIRLKNIKKNNIVWGGVITASILILFSFFAPFLFSLIGKIIFSDKTGYIGDTIGGLMNPFIAIAGVIITGLAFYMQYLSNKQVKKQFKEQQIESQAFEMIKLNRKSIDELIIKGRERIVYNKMSEDIKYSQYYDYNEVTITKNKAIEEIIKEFEILLEIFKKCNDNLLDQIVFNKTYKVFFNGIDELSDQINKNNSNNTKQHFINEDILKYIEKVRKHLIYPNDIMWDNSDLTDDLKTKVFNLKSTFELKHGNFLSSYFRNLFHTVKYITTQNISYNNKMNLMRMLRAQMSNQEQALLFYNWLANDFGGKWEEDKNEGNNFFTEYCLIHNLWYNKLFCDNFIETKIQYLKEKKVNFRKGKMFEIDEY